jgi:hypothetical protein
MQAKTLKLTLHCRTAITRSLSMNRLLTSESAVYQLCLDVTACRHSP